MFPADGRIEGVFVFVKREEGCCLLGGAETDQSVGRSLSSFLRLLFTPCLRRPLKSLFFLLNKDGRRPSPGASPPPSRLLCRGLARRLREDEEEKRRRRKR